LFHIFRVLSECGKKINLTLINLSPRFCGAKKDSVPRESRFERMTAAAGSFGNGRFFVRFRSPETVRRRHPADFAINNRQFYD
jgi:hypothetical protein